MFPSGFQKDPVYLHFSTAPNANTIRFATVGFRKRPWASETFGEEV